MNKYDIHYGAKQHIIEKAKELRKRETEAEKILLNNLRGRKLKGYKFRR